MHVLVCDDDTTTRFVAKRLLEQNFGCRVSECQDGVEALGLLEGGQFAFILLDVEMPTLNGIDTLEEIRNSPRTADLPVIILSALRDEAGVMKLMQLGISDYILKPIRTDNAVNKIAQLIRMLPPAETQLRDVSQIKLSPECPALLVDGNLDFRFYAANLLEKYGTVMQAESGAAALASFRRTPTSMVFVGGDLGLVGAERLVTKLREASQDGVRLIKLADPQDDIDKLALLFDGVAVRSFVPATMRAAVRPYVFIPGILHELSGLIPELSDVLTSAVRQVFGMMFDAEIGAGQAGDARTVAYRSRLDITLDGRFAMALGIHLTKDAGLGVTSKMFSMPPAELTDEDCASTVGELANLIAGRMHARFLERKLKSVCALPVVEEGGTLVAPDDSAGLLQAFGIPGGGDFYITLGISSAAEAATVAEPAPAASTAAPTAADKEPAASTDTPAAEVAAAPAPADAAAGAA